MFNFKKLVLIALVPLLLVFAGVIIGSIHGIDSDKEHFELTPAPSGSPAAAPTKTSSTVEGVSSGPRLTFAATGLPYDAPLVLS
ncbi:MAG TPA: hypothetical protein VI759_03765 [Dehalococcoidia bacterium]|nr:hypothetical protein [Dehalococcoidia bacterium]